MNKNIFLPIALVVLAVITRIMNIEMGLWYHISMIGAISLFSGAVIKNKALAFMLPFLAYLSTDIYLQFFTNTQGFYGISQFFTYGAMLLVVLLGSRMKNSKPFNVLGYSIGGSLIFWIVSNFGVWFGNLYTNLEPGLTLGFTYFRALPFYNEFGKEMFIGTFIGDMFYNVLLFGLYSVLTISRPTRSLA